MLIPGSPDAATMDGKKLSNNFDWYFDRTRARRSFTIALKGGIDHFFD